MNKTLWVMVGFCVVSILLMMGGIVLVWYREKQEEAARDKAMNMVGYYTIFQYLAGTDVINMRRDGDGTNDIDFQLLPNHLTEVERGYLRRGREIQLKYDPAATGQQDIPVSRYERFLLINFV